MFVVASGSATSTASKPASAGSSGSQYQSFDPTMRLPPTVKLRAVVGDDPDKAFVGVTLKQRDTLAKCKDIVMAG